MKWRSVSGALKPTDWLGEHVSKWTASYIVSVNPFFIFCLAKFVPVGYGISKLQINCIIEDDKIGTDFLEEEITKFEELVCETLTELSFIF